MEAAETAIWLIEVAPQAGKSGKAFIQHLANANHDANPELMRFALKLATGAGKTTVMAMLIAWQTINAVRRPQSKKFTRGFLVVTPGLMAQMGHWKAPNKTAHKWLKRFTRNPTQTRQTRHEPAKPVTIGQQRGRTAPQI